MVPTFICGLDRSNFCLPINVLLNSPKAITWLGVARAYFHPQDLSPARIQLTKDVAQEFFRSNRFDFHDWLLQNRSAFLETLFECNRAGYFESHFTRIYLVVRAIIQPDVNVCNRVSSQ